MRPLLLVRMSRARDRSLTPGDSSTACHARPGVSIKRTCFPSTSNDTSCGYIVVVGPSGDEDDSLYVGNAAFPNNELTNELLPTCNAELSIGKVRHGVDK